MSAIVASTRARRLLGALIDHAALFPPASMTMAEAVAEDRRVRASAEAWMVGRFLCPASRLDELGDELGGWSASPALGVVLDGAGGAPPDGWLAALERDLARLPPAAPVELVEVRLPQPSDDAGRRARAAAAVERVAARTGARLWLETTAPGISAVAAAGAGAKVRCGGAGVPSVDELAAFVAACRDAGVPLKATAGLHHPIRHPAGHGFLNLLAACAAAVRGAAVDELAALLALDDATAVLAAQEPSGRRLLVSFGSCSIREPVDDLRGLGVL